MSPDNANPFFSDPDDESAEWSRYEHLIIGDRDRALHDDQPGAEPANYGDVVWRWEFPVCNRDGRVMRHIRVNAVTEDQAALSASLRIDADRTLGRAVRVRRATET